MVLSAEPECLAKENIPVTIFIRTSIRFGQSIQTMNVLRVTLGENRVVFQFARDITPYDSN
jgi:hypothetical protein